MTTINGTWMEAPGTQAVMHVLADAGYQVFFVGGCVRNTLLGAPVADIDISTDAEPERVVALFERDGFKTIPTGIDHGTVTVLADGIPHEITTFRKDVTTDGRRATVAFSKELQDDAERRDFTMNALYASADGTVLDPVGGLKDLKNRYVRFINDPAQRIAEDYLRILRFFRFHAWYGDPLNGLDADALAGCADALDGLETLSNERIGHEMCKLLDAPDPAPSVAAMAQTGVLARVMPGASTGGLAPLVHLEDGIPPDWIRRVAALGAEPVSKRWRLSRKDSKKLDILKQQISSDHEGAEIAYRHGSDMARDVVLVRAAMTGQPISPKAWLDVERGATAAFPIKASDLASLHSGAALGAKLRELEDRWIASDFKLTREELLG